MKEPIPKQIQNICNFLKNQNINLSKKFEEGRLNAAINEHELLQEISKEFSVIPHKVGIGMILLIEDSTTFYPVNIKITDMTHADNSSGSIL